MKKIFFVALGATLLAAGCQKTEIINHVPGEAMTFSTAMGKLTKTVGTADADNVDGMVNLQAQDFKVWAYCAYADEINEVELGDVYDEMEALDVTYGTAWATQKDYYWPGTGKSLDFFAVSTAHWPVAEVKNDAGEVVTPAVAGVNVDITGEGETVGSRSMVISNYAVDAANPNDDLMVAEFVRQHQNMNEKKVSLHFKHALAKVQFRFTTNPGTDAIKVNSLSVAELNTVGKLTVSEVANTYVETNGRVSVSLAWTEQATAATFNDDYDGSLTLKAPESVTDAEGKVTEKKNDQEFATWLVLPQDITGKTVTIAYEITSSTGTRNFTQTFALTRPAVAEVKDGETIVTPGKEAFASWDINQVIVYTINLSPNKITFDPSVEPWKEADNLTDQN